MSASRACRMDRVRNSCLNGDDMVPGSVPDFVELLRRYRLLTPAQADELTREPALRPADPRELAKELVRRGWLTPFQADQVFLSHAADLLLGSYVLLDKLGEGGMGAVFRARNWKLGQVVAVKLIRKERLASA